MVVYTDDVLSQKLQVYGKYEKEFLECLEKNVLPNFTDKICLDIGANIGNHSLTFSNYFKHIYSFEPNKRTFQLLKLNTSNKENITPFNVGASDVNKVYQAYEVVGNTAASRIVEGTEALNDKEDYTSYECKILDDYLPEEVTSEIGFIKIDVEGHEYQAVKSCTEIIKKSKPTLVLEILKSSYVNGSYEVINLLKELGYSSFYELHKVAFLYVKMRKIETFKRKNYKMILAKF